MWFLCRGHLIALVATVCFASFPAHALTVNEFEVLRSEWPKYPNGTNLAGLSALNKPLRAFEENGNQRIVVRYPGGEGGRQWASMVSDWFIAYGIPGRYVSTELGSAAADRLLILLFKE
ncbi:MAG: hypothetical protein AAF402_06125 [Pseudomonadota bacterium]